MSYWTEIPNTCDRENRAEICDRQLVDSGDTEYSIYGTALDSGPFYEPKFLRTITCFLTKDEYQTLQAIFQYGDQKHRNQKDYRVIVDD